MSINTLSEENKEFITSLYGLKAGLSLISVEADKIREAEKACEDSRVALEDAKYRLEGRRADIARVEAAKKDVDDKLEKNRADVKKYKMIGYGCVAGLFIGLIPACGIAAVIMMSSPGMGVALIAALVIAAIILLIVGIQNCVRANNMDMSKIYKRDSDSAAARIDEMRRNLPFSEGETSVAEARYNSARLSYDIALRESGEKGMAMYTALVESYERLLDRRDWGSVDYIIYVYETGRASSLPEALRLLDEERRYEGIVQAVDRASAIISHTIRDSISMLGAQLSSQIRTLGDRVEESNKKLARAYADASESIVASNSRISAELEIQNALIAKSNVNTGQLAEDMHYIVDHARLRGF